MTLPFLTKFQKIIGETDELSQISKYSYQTRLKKLTDITLHDIDWILKNCNKTLELIEKAGVTEPQTFKSYINAVLACFKYSNLQDTHKKAYECWTKTRIKVNSIAQEKYENLQASPKQIEVYVPWNEIIETRDKLNNDSDEYLLLSLYTMIPPSRADFNNTRIFKKEPSLSQKEKQNNYLIVQGDYMKLVFNEFKCKRIK